MSNFRALPHPSQASSNSLVYLSIWPKPRSHAIGLIQSWSSSQVSALLNLSWEGRSTPVSKTSLSKPGPVGQQGGEQRHCARDRSFLVDLNTQAVCFHSPFQQDVLIHSPVQLKVLSKEGPRHALVMG